MKRLLAVLLLVAAPAHAEVPPEDWTKCVIATLMPEDTQRGSVATWGVAAAVQCRHLYPGDPDGMDVRMAVRLLERIREMAAVSKPVLLPPGDRRF